MVSPGNRRTDRSSRSSLSLPTNNYHSAHKPPVDAPALDRWEGNGCTAFVHDLTASPTLPADYDRCDVLMADLPWQKGYDTFNERAGVSAAPNYVGFMGAVGAVVESTTAPLYLVTGKHALSKLPTPDVTLPVILNAGGTEYESLAVGYRPGDEADGRYTFVPELLHVMAQRYDTVGDFCCGYGRNARYFLRSGKHAVVSDFNAQCIGYISDHAPGWVTR